MLISQPMLQTEVTPEKLIGFANMPVFQKHYAISTSQANGGDFPDKRLDKEVGKANRLSIAETYRHLREHGFYPDGMNPNMSIRWKVVTKSKSQIMMESRLTELQAMSESELQKRARDGWRPLMDSVKVKK